MGSRASLNPVYRSIWNQSLGAMVAVAEIAPSQGGGSAPGSGELRPLLAPQDVIARIAPLALSLALVWGVAAPAAWANPTGAAAIVGSANLATQGNKLTVTTQNGVGLQHSAINWQSFSIPAGNTTHFQQPSAASTVINRVVTNVPSQLFGTLSSNGHLVLVNQAGIAVGAGALVDTAGFTASALRMSDADALAGRLRFGDATVSTAGVSVQGRILARSGDAVLIAPNIDTGKDALIQAPNGSTLLAAGQQLEITGRGLEGISFQVQAPTDQALNLGMLSGNAVGIFAGTLKHSGQIRADAVTVEGGKVVLKASRQLGVVGQVSAQAMNQRGGTIQATAPEVLVQASAVLDASGATGGGTIRIGEISADSVNVAGRLDASAPVSGNGGFIETSAVNLKVAESAVVTTQAANGKTGTWLIDPLDFTISEGGAPQSASGIGASTLSTALADNNVSIATTGYAGDGLGNGDIFVSSAVSWDTNNTLTLNAYRNNNVNSAITATGSGGVNLVAGGNLMVNQSITSTGALGQSATGGNGGNGSAGGPISLQAGAAITVSALVKSEGGAGGTGAPSEYPGGLAGTGGAGGSGGTVTLQAGSAITIGSTGSLVSRGGAGGAGGTEGAGVVGYMLGYGGYVSGQPGSEGGAGGAGGAGGDGGVIALSVTSLSAAAGAVTLMASAKVESIGGAGGAGGTGGLGGEGGGGYNDVYINGGIGGNGGTGGAGGFGGVGGAGGSSGLVSINAGYGGIVMNASALVRSVGGAGGAAGAGGYGGMGGIGGNAGQFGSNPNYSYVEYVLFDTPGDGGAGGNGGQGGYGGQGGNSGGISLLSKLDIALGQVESRAGVGGATGTAGYGGFAGVGGYGGTLTYTPGGFYDTNNNGFKDEGEESFSGYSLYQPSPTGASGATGGAGAVGNVGGYGLPGNLTIVTEAGLAQTAAALVSGATTVSAGGTVALTHAGNDFQGSVAISAAGQSVSLVDANGLTLGNTTAANLSLTTGGALTQTQGTELSVPGLTTVSAGGAVALTNGANNFGTLAVSAPNQSVALIDVDALIVDATTAGNLTLTAGGAITQTAAITASGASSITASGNGDITLEVAGNNFSSLSLTASAGAGGAIRVVDTNALTLTALAAGTNRVVSVVAGGALTLPAININTGSANLTLSSGGTLTTPGNLSGGNVALTGITGLTLAHSVAASGALALNGGNVQVNSVVSSVGAMSVNASGSLQVLAPNGPASLQAGGSQTIEANSLLLRGGASGSGRSALISSGGAQSITTTQGITLEGGAAGGGLGIGNFAFIGSDGSQSISAGSNGIILTAGGGSGNDTDNFANIYQRGIVSGSTQTLTLGNGGTLRLTGGSSALSMVGSGHGSRAVVQGDGSAQNINFTNGGGIALTGGTAGSRARAMVYAGGSASQTITGGPTVVVTGGSGNIGVTSEDNHAEISTFNGSQSLTVASIALTGGISGNMNQATIYQGGATGTQTVNVSAGGSIQLQGGTGTASASNFAVIAAQGAAQNISFAGAGGALSLTGGTVGTDNFAGLVSQNSGPQTITGVASLALNGGASGGAAGLGNRALITASGGTQNVTASTIALNGGASGTENFAGLSAGGQTQTISAGSITLQGGGSGGVRIGAQGNATPLDLTLTVGGNLVMAGGTMADSGVAIGNSGTSTAAAKITVVAGGDITMSPGSLGNVRIGSSSSTPPAGDISLSALNGSLVVNSSASLRPVIGTGGNVSLRAGSLSLGGKIQGNTVVADSSLGVTLGDRALITATATAGDAIVIDAGDGPFTSTAVLGSAALVRMGSSRWLLYSNNPANDTLGGLSPGFKQYGLSYGTAPTAAGAGLNGLLYTVAPAIAVSVVGPVSKTYDGGTSATLAATNYSQSGALAGDTVSLNTPTVGSYSSGGTAAAAKDVGTGKTVTVSGLSGTALNGAIPVYGYQIPSTASGDVGEVTPKTVSLSAGKVYDGTTDLGGKVTVVTGIGAETLNYTGAQASAAHVATAGKYISAINLTNGAGGGLASNYQLPALTSANAANAPVTIEAAQLSASAAIDGALSRAYDGGTAAGTAASVTGHVLGAVGGDTLTLNTSAVNLAYNSKDVLTANTIAASGNATLAISSSVGSLASDYSFSAPSIASVAATISPKALSGSIVVAGKTYDASTAANISSRSLSGVIGVEDVSYIGGVASFADKNAGLAKVVTATGLSLAGADAGNYSVNSSASTTAAISKADLTVSSTAVSKTYDGTLSAAGTAVVSAGTLFSGDTLSGGSFAFTDKNAGTNKTVTVAGVTLDDGNSGGNYNLSYASNTASNTASSISPKALSATANAAGKTYDGNTTASVSLSGLSGLVGTETLGVSAAGSFDTKNAGTGKTVTVNSVALQDGANGGLANNYQLASGQTATADIARATLSVSGSSAANKTYDGTSTAVITTGTLSGFIGSEKVSASASGNFDSKNAGARTATAIYTLGDDSLSGGLSGGLAGNYTLSDNSLLSATIAQRAASTWIAGTTGTWSNPANWDAIPDRANVLDVAIPAGVTVQFDSAAGATQLRSLTSAGALTLTGGSLAVAKSLSTSNYVQTGGTLSGTGALTVSTSFSQSGGSIDLGGVVDITQVTGNLSVGAISAASIRLAAQNGAISQTGALVTAGLLATQSAGSTVLTDAGNLVNALSANSTGDLMFTNTGLLDVRGLLSSLGNIEINNTGGISTSGAVSAPSGAIALTANSPLTVGTAGVQALGDVNLTATDLTSAGNITLNGKVVSTSGSVALAAANNLVQNSAISAALGVTGRAGLAGSGGAVSFGADASSDAKSISYLLNGLAVTAPPQLIKPVVVVVPPTNFVTAFLDVFENALTEPVAVAATASATKSTKTETEPAAKSAAADSEATADKTAGTTKEKDKEKEKEKEKTEVVIGGNACTPG